MIIKTKAVALHKTPYGDNSLIVHLFTEQLGRQSVIIKGCRSKKNTAKLALFQASSLLSCEIDFKENANLHFIKEVNLDIAYCSIFSDINKSSVAIFICEIISKTIREEGPQQDLFRFIHKNLNYLDKTEDKLANFPIFFLLRLLPYLGFRPSDNYSKDTQYFNIKEGVFMPTYTNDFDTCSISCSEILYRLMLADISNYHKIKIHKAQRIEILEKMLKYYSIHIEGFVSLKSLPILQEVLSAIKQY